MKIKMMAFILVTIFFNFAQADGSFKEDPFTKARWTYDHVIRRNYGHDENELRRVYGEKIGVQLDHIIAIKEKLVTCATKECKQYLKERIALHEQNVINLRKEEELKLNDLDLYLVKMGQFLLVDAFIWEIRDMADYSDESFETNLKLQFRIESRENCSKTNSDYGTFTPDNRLLTCIFLTAQFNHQHKRYEIKVALGMATEADLLDPTPEKYTKDLEILRNIFSSHTFMDGITLQNFLFNQSPYDSFVLDKINNTFYFKKSNLVDFHILSIKKIAPKDP